MLHDFVRICFGRKLIIIQRLWFQIWHEMLAFFCFFNSSVNIVFGFFFLQNLNLNESFLPKSKRSFLPKHL